MSSRTSCTDHTFRAAHGAHGRGRDCFGASAEDLEVLVPVGTIVRDDQGNQLADLVEVGQRFEAAKGGRGGLGNLNFVSATNQAPTECTPGEPGEERELDLELQLIADCGLVGLPNAGKSTFWRMPPRPTHGLPITRSPP